EIQAENRVVMYMKDWIEKLDAFLNFNQLDVLNNAGKISREVAGKLATREYEKYNIIQDKTYISDFDIMVDKYFKE
ncbi:MAG: RhuM family protein, partial [Bacilli bacterium]|nr:RhuM family protein [Bacilli bacterium]